jgi:putative ABC transport system permease protein
MALPISYNVRNVIQRPVSTLTTALGVGLTVAIFIGALALASGFRAALVSTGSADNVIVLRTGADSEISSGISRDASDVIRALPDVAPDPDGHPLVSPEVVVVITKQRLGQPGSSNVTVRGVDAVAMRLRDRVKIAEGRMFTPGTDEVIVGLRISRRFAGCGLGDHMRFGQREFTVVGLFTADGASFESEAWGDNAVLMPVFRGEVFQSVTFRMRDPSRFAAIKQVLEADPRLHVQAKLESAFYAEQSQTLASLIQFIGVFITLIMAVGAVFGAMNTMYAAVGARTREIATLLVLGFSPWSIMVSFMIESVFLSLIGGALGCVLALPINGISTGTTNFQSFSELAFAFQVTPAALLAGLAFSAAMGVVGGFLPALRAARQPLAAALRAT